MCHKAAALANQTKEKKEWPSKNLSRAAALQSRTPCSCNLWRDLSEICDKLFQIAAKPVFGNVAT